MKTWQKVCWIFTGIIGVWIIYILIVYRKNVSIETVDSAKKSVTFIFHSKTYTFDGSGAVGIGMSIPYGWPMTKYLNVTTVPGGVKFEIDGKLIQLAIFDYPF